jgi:hypothetical protein
MVVHMCTRIDSPRRYKVHIHVCSNMCVHTPDPDIHTDNGCQSTVPGTGLLKVPQVPQQVWTSTGTRVQVYIIYRCATCYMLVQV